MTSEIMELFSKHIKDNKRADAINLIERNGKSLDLDDQELFDYYEQQFSEGIFFWDIKPAPKKGGKVVAIIKERSFGEFIHDEVVSAIESMIQVWCGNTEPTSIHDRRNYVTVIDTANRYNTDKELLKSKWINGQTNEFILNDYGIVEVVDRQNAIDTINKLFETNSWVKLEKNIFDWFIKNKSFLVRKLIIDDFISYENKPLEKIRYGITNWFVDDYEVRKKIIEAYHNRNDNSIQKKILQNTKMRLKAV